LGGLKTGDPLFASSADQSAEKGGYFNAR
jgi:hypothetical protein